MRGLGQPLFRAAQDLVDRRCRRALVRRGAGAVAARAARRTEGGEQRVHQLIADGEA
jgi:hypothetical protein